MLRGAFLLTSLLSPGLAWAQFNPGADQAPKPNPPTGGNVALAYNPLARPELWLSIACIAFGLIILMGQFALLRRMTHLTSDDIIKNCTITIVVIGALVLIIAGYDSQQTAQAFGLFGTIVGYLLGRSSNRTPEQNAPQTPQ